MAIKPYQKYNREDTKPAEGVSHFHGESWYRCPWCNKTFEFFDTQFQRGFQMVDDGLYRHDECGKLLTLT